jgi:hypothetical protein
LHHGLVCILRMMQSDVVSRRLTRPGAMDQDSGDNDTSITTLPLLQQHHKSLLLMVVSKVLGGHGLRDCGVQYDVRDG